MSRCKRVRTEPSITMSSAWMIAPPISEASTASVSSTVRPSFCCERLLDLLGDRAVDGVADVTVTFTLFSASAFSASNCAAISGSAVKPIVLGEQLQQVLALRRREQLAAFDRASDRADELARAGVVERRIRERALGVRIGQHGRRSAERRRPRGQLALGVREIEQRFRVGPGDGARSRPSLQLAANLPSKSRCALASISRPSTFSAPATAMLRDLAAQLFASAIDLDADLGARRFELALARGFAVGLPLLDDARGARVRLIDDAARLVARRRDDLVGLDLGHA